MSPPSGGSGRIGVRDAWVYSTYRSAKIKAQLADHGCLVEEHQGGHDIHAPLYLRGYGFPLGAFGR